MSKFIPAKVGIMLDIESLALGAACIVTQAAIHSFALDDPETTLFASSRHFPIEPQLEALLPARKLSAKTLGFWLRQGDDARLKLASHLEGDLDELTALLRAFVRDFKQATEGLSKHDYEVWAKGPQLDVAAMESLLTQCGIEVPWDYASVADLRTLMRLAQLHVSEVPQPEGFVHHDAGWDNVFQIKCYSIAMSRLFSAAG